MPVALSIAGSDSGGGAGIQADLKTFAAWGVHGTTALTCVTAQNPDGVSGIEALSPQLVRAQILAVTNAFPVQAIKTGMLYSAALIETVAETLKACTAPNLVIDPVMVASSGARLLQDDALDALRLHLLPLAKVVTPNVPEAEVLAGHRIDIRAAQIDAARRIADTFGVACVVKGGHLRLPTETEPGRAAIVDVLATPEGHVQTIRTAAIDTTETHGTGCTFAAALAAALAHGHQLEAAVKQATQYVSLSLQRAVKAGRHLPLGWFPAR